MIHRSLIEGQIDRLRRRIGRIVHHQHLGARHGVGHGPFEAFEIALVRRGRHAADRRPGDDEAKGEDRVGGVGRQDDVAGFGDSRRQTGQTFLGAHGDDHLGVGIQVHAETAGVVVGLGATQAGNAARRRIAVGVGLARHFAQLVDHVRRRRQIGIAHAQVDDVLAGRAGGGAHGVGLRDHIRRQAFHAVEFFGHVELRRGAGKEGVSDAINGDAAIPKDRPFPRFLRQKHLIRRRRAPSPA